MVYENSGIESGKGIDFVDENWGWYGSCKDQIVMLIVRRMLFLLWVWSYVTVSRRHENDMDAKRV